MINNLSYATSTNTTNMEIEMMTTYKVEYHRVWVKTVEANNREEARRIAEEEMGEDSDAEDYNYSIVKRDA